MYANKVPKQSNADFICIIFYSPSTAANNYDAGRCIWMALLIIRRIINAEQQQCLDGGETEYILQ